MNVDSKHYSIQKLSKIRENFGMKKSFKTRVSNQEIGHCYLIQYLWNLKASYKIGGWDPMKQIQYMDMGQLNSEQQIKKDTP